MKICDNEIGQKLPSFKDMSILPYDYNAIICHQYFIYDI